MLELLKIPMINTDESSINDIGRPYIRIKSNNLEMKCILDTGANIPIFLLGEENLKLYFPNAKYEEKYKVKIVGFGEGGTPAKIFRVKSIRLDSCDSDDFIRIDNVLVACCNKAIEGTSLILSGGLFNNMDLKISTSDRDNCHISIEHKYNVYNGNGRIIGNDKLKRVYVLAQVGEGHD